MVGSVSPLSGSRSLNALYPSRPGRPCARRRPRPAGRDGTSPPRFLHAMDRPKPALILEVGRRLRMPVLGVDDVSAGRRRLATLARSPRGPRARRRGRTGSRPDPRSRSARRRRSTRSAGSKRLPLPCHRWVSLALRPAGEPAGLSSVVTMNRYRVEPAVEAECRCPEQQQSQSGRDEPAHFGAGERRSAGARRLRLGPAEHRWRVGVPAPAADGGGLRFTGWRGLRFTGWRGLRFTGWRALALAVRTVGRCLRSRSTCPRPAGRA